MKRVIRGLLYTEPEELDPATKNYGRVRLERLVDLSDSEHNVLEWLLEFHSKHGEAPSLRIVHDYFSNAHDDAAIMLVESASGMHFEASASFEATVEEVVEYQGATRMRRTFSESLEIATDGKEFAGQMVRGVQAAAAHAFSDLHLPPPKDDDRLHADMWKSASGLLDLYEHRENNPSDAFGVTTGYRCIDTETGGIRRKMLYLHAGFISHLKSTFIVNQLVRGVTKGWSGILFTDEMPAEEVMFLALAVHSGSEVFAKIHQPLDARKLMAGRLDTDEKRFFREVQAHFLGSPGFGSLRVIDSSEFGTFGSIQQRTAREHQECPIDIVWIDYLTRLPLDAKYRRLDHTTGMNLTIQEAKQWAMNFDGGKGLPVCSAFQINREGAKRGAENGGHLDARALSQFNAAEKEADIITYSWYGPDQRADNEMGLGFIKNRWGAVPQDPISLYYDEQCRAIYEQGGLVGPTNAGLSEADLIA